MTVASGGTLGCFPTPFHRHPGLADVLGLDDLWLKRDDLTGFGWGGNKVRTVEHLLADAISQQATTMVLASGAGSNFAATMTAAATGAGIAVERICAGSEPSRCPSGLVVSRRLGAAVCFTGDPDRSSMDRVAEERAQAIALAGGVPYVVPRGGATPVGSQGFAQAAEELAIQLRDRDLDPDHLIMAVGSGGSMAGLLAGLGLNWPLTGVSVSRPVAELTETIAEHARACARLRGVSVDRLPPYRIVDGRGSGFGIADPVEAELTLRVERLTGLLLDPTYTAKAARWLTAARPGGVVVLWHTGGALGIVDRLCDDMRTSTADPTADPSRDNPTLEPGTDR